MGKFVIKNVNTGIKFDLHAANGEIICTSEVYASKESCIKGIESIKHNAPIANMEDQSIEGYAQQVHPKFEIYVDKAGEFRFRLKARNGEEIAQSQAYTSKESCKKGIDSIIRNAPEAEIVEP